MLHSQHQNTLRENCLSESGTSDGSNGIAEYIVFGTLSSETAAETNQSHFGSRVIGLTKRPIEPCS